MDKKLSKTQNPKWNILLPISILLTFIMILVICLLDSYEYTEHFKDLHYSYYHDQEYDCNHFEGSTSDACSLYPFGNTPSSIWDELNDDNMIKAIIEFSIIGLSLSVVCIIVDIICKKLRTKSGKEAPCVPVWLSLSPLAVILILFAIDLCFHHLGTSTLIEFNGYIFWGPMAIFAITTLFLCYREKKAKVKPQNATTTTTTATTKKVEVDVSNMID